MRARIDWKYLLGLSLADPGFDHSVLSEFRIRVAGAGLELAGESVRAALEALAAAHPDWVAQRICVSDFACRYGTPLTSWRAPGQPGQAG